MEEYSICSLPEQSAYQTEGSEHEEVLACRNLPAGNSISVKGRGARGEICPENRACELKETAVAEHM